MMMIISIMKMPFLVIREHKFFALYIELYINPSVCNAYLNYAVFIEIKFIYLYICIYIWWIYMFIYCGYKLTVGSLRYRLIHYLSVTLDI